MKTINDTRLKRFARSMFGIAPGRKGKCNPEKCSTLDGQKGAACCKMNGSCLFLKTNDNCIIYKHRPLNCRSFPTTPQDLELVNGCGYYW